MTTEDIDVTVKEAFPLMKIGETKLRELMAAGELTVNRDEVGRGFKAFLLRDEVEAYRKGKLPGLRKFRRQKGRA